MRNVNLLTTVIINLMTIEISFTAATCDHYLSLCNKKYADNLFNSVNSHVNSNNNNKSIDYSQKLSYSNGSEHKSDQHSLFNLDNGKIDKHNENENSNNNDYDHDTAILEDDEQDESAEEVEEGKEEEDEVEKSLRNNKEEARHKREAKRKKITRESDYSKKNERCVQMRKYRKCLGKQERYCRGYLHYHFQYSLSKRIFKRQCSTVSHRLILKSFNKNAFNENDDEDDERHHHQFNNTQTLLSYVPKKLFNSIEFSTSKPFYNGYKDNDDEDGKEEEDDDEKMKIRFCLESAYDYSINKTVYSYLKYEKMQHSFSLSKYSLFKETNSLSRKFKRNTFEKHLFQDDQKNDDDDDFEENDDQDENEEEDEKKVRNIKDMKKERKINMDEKDYFMKAKEKDGNKDFPTAYQNSTRRKSINTLNDEGFFCAVFGNIHLRTLTKIYQTCNCSGAWPLIEHPLFAIQFTNSRSQSSTIRVVVLIKQFFPCDLHKNLIYEAEIDQVSAKKTYFSPTFIDGSISNAYNLIKIEVTSSKSLVIHMKHIGIAVHIAGFNVNNIQSNSNNHHVINHQNDVKNLNVVVKLDDKVEKQKKINFINALSDLSLCKVGCPKRELINVHDVLKFIDNYGINNNNKHFASCNRLIGFYRDSCLYEYFFKRKRNLLKQFKFIEYFDHYTQHHNQTIVKLRNKSQRDYNNFARSRHHYHHNQYFIYFANIILLLCFVY